MNHWRDGQLVLPITAERARLLGKVLGLQLELPGHRADMGGFGDAQSEREGKGVVAVGFPIVNDHRA